MIDNFQYVVEQMKEKSVSVDVPENVCVFSKASLDDELVDIIVKSGTIVEISPFCQREANETPAYYDGGGVTVIDLQGMELFPLMLDVHTHLREPGQEYKEGLENGLRAALLNGISRVAMMANTDPVLDNAQLISHVHNKAKSLGFSKTNINAAATMGLKGLVPSDMSLFPYSVRAVSDDGFTIKDEGVLEEVFSRAKKVGLVVISHCERPGIQGFMQACEKTFRDNISSILEEDESTIIERNITMAKKVGCRLHIAHVSTIKGVEMIEKGRREGVRVTCEVTPHHLFLSLDDVDYRDGFYKVNPPLRCEETRQFLLDALCRGKIDILATDHAPHAMSEKTIPISEASFGFSGFDSFFLNIYTHLIGNGKMSFARFNELTSLNPAKLLGVSPEMIEKGGDASFMVIEKGKFILERKHLLSRGKNNPFIGKSFNGRISMVVKNGIVHTRGYE